MSKNVAIIHNVVCLLIIAECIRKIISHKISCDLLKKGFIHFYLRVSKYIMIVCVS